MNPSSHRYTDILTLFALSAGHVGLWRPSPKAFNSTSQYMVEWRNTTRTVLHRERLTLRHRSIDTISRRGDVFAPTVRATAGSSEPSAITEDKIAVLAARGLQHKPAGLITRDRFDDMDEMVFDLSFRHREHLGQLVRRQTRTDQQFHDALARGPFRWNIRVW